MLRVFTQLRTPIALALGIVLTGAASERPPIEGFWDTPGGRLLIERKGKVVRGILITPADGTSLAKDAKVLKGIFEEDNLSAEVPVGMVAPSCQGKESAFVVMLLTRRGKLTGGVSTKDACASSVSTVQFVRSSDQHTGAPVKAAKVEAPPGSGQYDAHGRRKQDMRASLKPMMYDAQHYMEEGQFEKARTIFLKVIHEDGTIGEAYNGVGVTYRARNDYESAISWYKQGLEAAPGFGDLYYNLACAYALEDKSSLALRYFKLAVTKGYVDVGNIDSDTDLDPLRKDPTFIELRKGLGPTPASDGTAATQAPAP